MAMIIPGGRSDSEAPRETIEHYLERKLNSRITGSDAEDPWQELVNTIHNDESTWNTNVLADLGLYARTLTPSIGNKSDCMEKVAYLVGEVALHLNLGDKKTTEKVIVNHPEWNWAKSLVDTTALGKDYVLLPTTRPDRSQDLQTLQNLLATSRSNNSSFVSVAVQGNTPQKVSASLLERLINSQEISNISRLVDLIYQPLLKTPLSLDVVFASGTLQDLLDAIDIKPGEGTTYLPISRSIVSERALDWMNTHAHDLARAPINQTDKNLTLELLGATNYLQMPVLVELFLRRIVDLTPDTELEELKSSKIFRFAAQLLQPPGEVVKDPAGTFIQKFHSIKTQAETLHITVDPNMPFSMILEQINLLLFFDSLKNAIPQNIPQQMPPNLNLTGDRPAETVRNWMRDNQNILNQITRLICPGILITALPDEIKLLRNLQMLDLTGTPITALPDEFNLQDLFLNNTPIKALPDGFNPQNLERLDLRNTLIEALPVGFNPQNLKNLYLRNTPIKALPKGFNPPNLQRLFLGHTPITALPNGFNPQKLEELDLRNTPIKALPDGFIPPQGMTLYCDDAFWDNLGDNIKNRVIRGASTT